MAKSQQKSAPKQAQKSGPKEAQYRLLPIGPQLKAVLKIAYRARRPVLLEGPTGIGKSEIVAQVADELGIGRVVLDLSLLEPPDLVGLPQVQEGRTGYAAPMVLPTEGEGILMLEELNRAERYIQQPALQLLTARRLHEYVLPEGWSACAAINPERGEYQVTPLDPALRSRFMNLLVRADRRSWLSWAEASGVHPAVLSVARRHDHCFDDVPPRSWTYASEVLKVLMPQERVDARLVRAVLVGYLAPAWVEVLVDAIESWQGESGLDVASLLADYHKNPKLQKLVRDHLAEGRTDRLEEIAQRLRSILEGPELAALVGRKAFSLDAFDGLTADLPGDHREQLQELLLENRASALLAEIPPEHLMRGYDSGPMARRVDAWLADPAKEYHVRLLVKALCLHLEEKADLIQLRRSMGDRIGLGHFLAQLGPKRSGPLRETCERFSIEPKMPEKRRKPR